MLFQHQRKHFYTKLTSVLFNGTKLIFQHTLFMPFFLYCLLLSSTIPEFPVFYLIEGISKETVCIVKVLNKSYTFLIEQQHVAYEVLLLVVSVMCPALAKRIMCICASVCYSWTLRLLNCDTTTGDYMAINELKL